MANEHVGSVLRVGLGIALLALAVTTHLRGEREFFSIKTAHFEVQYQHGVSDQDAKKVADYLETDYALLSKKLGLDFKKRLEVRVYDAVGKFSAKANRTRSWRGAIYWRGVLHVQPVQALVMRKILEQSLSFELVLALLEQVAERGCPRWLCVAFAVYHSGSATSVGRPLGVRLASFSDLEQDLQTYPNPPQRNDVHYVLGSTMSFFVKKYGEQKSFGLFKSFDGQTAVEQVVKKCFGQDYGDVEREWAAYVRSHPAPRGE
jgi:hypothetical protein